MANKQLRPLCEEHGGDGATGLSDAQLALLITQDLGLFRGSHKFYLKFYRAKRAPMKKSEWLAA